MTEEQPRLTSGTSERYFEEMQLSYDSEDGTTYADLAEKTEDERRRALDAAPPSRTEGLKERKKNEILAKNANVTKTTTQQSSTGFLYHPTVPFFSFIWSFSPK